MDYQIIRSNRKTLAIQIKPDGQILVRAPFGVDSRDISHFVNEHADWINKSLSKFAKQKEQLSGVKKLTEEERKRLILMAKDYIPERVNYYASLLGVTYGRITIRAQKTRWGSCSSKGNLNFNYLLMLCPQPVIDSVIVHELCHRLEMNHSRRFYALVYKIYPEYDKCHKWLKSNANILMNSL